MDAKGVSGLLSGSLCVVCVAALTLPAQAGDTTWQQDPNTPGSWFEANNWDNGVPTTADTAYITNGGVAEISAGTAGASSIYLGYGTGSAGTISQSGGTNLVGLLDLGHEAGSSGTYELAGGTLLVGGAYVSRFGAGSFTQTGGVHIVDSLRAGYFGGANGTYTISNGTLKLERAELGFKGTATLNVTGSSAEITVGKLLTLGFRVAISAVPGSTIHMTTRAGFLNWGSDPNVLVGLNNLTLLYEAGGGDVEVSGEDMGETTAGQTGNFALHTLQVGSEVGPAKIQVVDRRDNQPSWDGNEALYVQNLIVNPASVLHLSGVNLYADGNRVSPGDGNNYGGGEIVAGRPGGARLQDMDGDGELTTDDINPFVLAIADPDAYFAQYGVHPDLVGDSDWSGKMDCDDIDDFVNSITGGQSAIPEPATLALLAAAGSLGLLRRWRRFRRLR